MTGYIPTHCLRFADGTELEAIIENGGSLCTITAIRPGSEVALSLVAPLAALETRQLENASLLIENIQVFAEDEGKKLPKLGKHGDEILDEEGMTEFLIETVLPRYLEIVSIMPKLYVADGMLVDLVFADPVTGLRERLINGTLIVERIPEAQAA